MSKLIDQGLAEYAFYFLTVFGGLLLRLREPSLLRPYRPIVLFPIVFCVASLFLVLRGLLFAPVQGAVLGALVMLGACWHFYKSRDLKQWRWRELSTEEREAPVGILAGE